MTMTRLSHIKPQMYSIVPGINFEFDVLSQVASLLGDPVTFQYWRYSSALAPIEKLGQVVVPHNNWPEGESDAGRSFVHLAGAPLWVCIRTLGQGDNPDLRTRFRLNYWGTGNALVGNDVGDDAIDIFAPYMELAGFKPEGYTEEDAETYQVIFVARTATAAYLLVKILWWEWPPAETPWTTFNGVFHSTTLALLRIDGPSSFSVTAFKNFDFGAESFIVETLRRAWLTPSLLLTDTHWPSSTPIDELTLWTIPAGGPNVGEITESWTGAGPVAQGGGSLVFQAGVLSRAASVEGPLTALWPAISEAYYNLSVDASGGIAAVWKEGGGLARDADVYADLIATLGAPLVSGLMVAPDDPAYSIRDIVAVNLRHL